MKIIDLLNMIAEGKEVPKKIMHKEMVYVFNSNLNAYQRPYYDEDGYKYSLGYHPKDANILMELNDTVEIIEEDNNKIEYLNIDAFSSLECKAIGRRVNQIIDKINNME